MISDKYNHYIHKKLNEDSTLADIAKHPIGHDLLQKISMFTLKSDKLLDSKLLSNLSLKTISNHTEHILEKDFFQSFFTLVNSDIHMPHIRPTITPAWWKEAVFYQIYPRMISKVNNEPRYKKAVATLLATLQMTLKGTPFIYQGEEIAMENIPFNSIDEIEDVESINMYNKYLETMSTDEAFSKILAGTRDHARAMLNWDDIHKQLQAM